MENTGIDLPALELQMLQNNQQSGYNYRYRRHADWDEIYEFYRDKVIINRLTQRQSVNVPLMKTQVRTLLKDVDDMPVLYFENLDNDKQAELFKNEYWKETVECNNMELQDIVDKRQVLLFGRSFDQWQIMDGKVKMTVQDPMDILVSRDTDPFDLNSSRFLIHNNIFIPLSKLLQNKDYDQAALNEMKLFYATNQGLVKAAENQKILTEKNKKMADMGVLDIQSPVLGETYINLSLHFVYKNDDYDEKGKTVAIDEQLYLYVVADNMRILMKKPLEEVIGVTKDHYFRNHYPYVSWADDLERQDFWSDSVGDIIRTPNKILNSWFSQLVENRALRNFGMNYFNSNIEGWQPGNYDPIPGGWYGVPVPVNGDIRQVMQKVEIPDLSESLDEMEFLITMSEKASGATATQQGAANKRQLTLGEIKLDLVEAKERVKGMSKFFTPAWKQRGILFTKLIEAAPEKLDAVVIYRKGLNSNNVHKREISPKDYVTPSGYGVRVWSQDEKDSQDVDKLNKLNAVKANMPGNQKLDEIFKRKQLEFTGALKPDEINEVMQIEEQNAKQAETPPPTTEKLSINYKDAPPDIQRQMEKAAGFVPSQMVPQQQQPATDPGMSEGMPVAGAMPQPQAPAPAPMAG